MLCYSLGCHPHWADRLTEEGMLHLETLATNRKLTKLVALGEMGLDYSDKNVVKRDLQKKVLI